MDTPMKYAVNRFRDPLHGEILEILPVDDCTSLLDKAEEIMAFILPRYGKLPVLIESNGRWYQLIYSGEHYGHCIELGYHRGNAIARMEV